MTVQRKRLLSVTFLFALTIFLSGTWWILSDQIEPGEQKVAAGSAPAGMEPPGFIERATPGPVEPVVVDLWTIAPGQLDPNNKYHRWLKGNVDFSKRNRIVSADRFKALREASPRLAPSFEVQIADDAIGPSAPLPDPAGTFDSIDYLECCGGGGNVPPDPEMAAGPNHLIAVVNVAFEIYDKSGVTLQAPTTFQSFMNANPNCTNVFDPNALYDEEADRFILGVATTGGYYCAAVSQTGDPTGLWNIYAFQTASGGEFFDYPHAGVGRDAIYVGSNIFQGGFKEGRIFALDKTAMYAGNPAIHVTRGLGNTYDSSQPLNLHGWDQGTWPSSGPHYFFSDRNYNGRTYAIHAWADPFGANTLTVAGVVDLNAATGVTAGMPLNVPQLGGGTVDGGDWRPQDFEYRNGFGWTAMAIACNPGGGSVNCVRWAQIDLATASVADAGVYASNGTYRSYADLAANDCGDMAVGYTKSNSDMYPGIWYTGRIDGDPAGILQPETGLKSGELPYTAFDGATYRWGDYTGMTIDPNGETFWYLGEYSKSTGTSSGRWGTYIGSFSFNCDATPLLDSEPPVRSNGQPSGTLPAGTTEATLTLSTDEIATCRYDTDANKDFALMANIFTITGGQAHQSTVGGLGDGQSYTFFVRCQDDALNFNTDDYGISFSVAAAGTPPATLHIADLDGTAINSGKNWQASVAPTVRDNYDYLVDGAQVHVDWSGDASGSASCTTDVNGTCDVTTGNIPKKHTNSVVFTIADITLSLTYDSTANWDPDGDSSGTAIQVNKDGTTQDPGNQPPSAGFSFTMVDTLTASFTDQSSDSDGTIVSWSWTFGDGGTSTAQNPPPHTYASADMYSVSLTVTDNNGAIDNDTQTVPVGVTAPPDPVVGGCLPISGDPNQRLTVTVSGTDFQDGATVDFGDRIAVQGVTFNGPEELAVRIKVHRQATSGPRDVTVTNPDTGNDTKVGCFTVN